MFSSPARFRNTKISKKSLKKKIWKEEEKKLPFQPISKIRKSPKISKKNPFFQKTIFFKETKIAGGKNAIILVTQY